MRSGLAADELLEKTDPTLDDPELRLRTDSTHPAGTTELGPEKGCVFLQLLDKPNTKPRVDVLDVGAADVLVELDARLDELLLRINPFLKRE